MSNQFNFEPYPNGKVLLTTTVGDIEVELWGAECPLTVRNFIQLCMEQFYDGLIFHRVVKNFIVQTGDPTGTGLGGESIYGKDFELEIHPRLRFNRRGILGMANTGQNDNNSQFFITLGNSLELQGKYTCFGRIVGDTIFNVLKIGECETDKDDRPMYPPKIISTKILLNPFEDIIPRISKKELEAQRANLIESNITKKPKKKGKKDKNLLSFEDDDMIDIQTSKKFKMKSSFDTINYNSDLSKEEPVIKTILDIDQSKIPETYNPSKSKASSSSKSLDNNNSSKKHNDDENKIQKPKPQKSSIDKKEDIKLQIQKLEEELKNKALNRQKEIDPKANLEKKSFLEQQRDKYKSKAIVGKRKKIDEDETLDKFFTFQTKLTKVKDIPLSTETKSLEEQECALHSVPNCQSCQREIENNVDDNIGSSWMGHKLKFDKDRLGKDLTQRKDKLEDYTVIDPRAQLSQKKDHRS